MSFRSSTFVYLIHETDVRCSSSVTHGPIIYVYALFLCENILENHHSICELLLSLYYIGHKQTYFTRTSNLHRFKRMRMCSSQLTYYLRVLKKNVTLLTIPAADGLGLVFELERDLHKDLRPNYKTVPM